jgi:hypothetical protein
MPDHLHLMHERDVHAALIRGLEAFAEWRRARGGPANLWLEVLPADRVEGPDDRRQRVRSAHAVPCRAGLVPEPLLWPFSTHLDACGLAVAPARDPAADPVAFHAFVSADSSLLAAALDLPTPRSAPLSLHRVAWAVSASTRRPLPQLFAPRSRSRVAFLGAARRLTAATPAQIGAFAGVAARVVTQARPLPDAPCEAIARVAALPLLGPVVARDLSRLYQGTRFQPAW